MWAAHLFFGPQAASNVGCPCRSPEGLQRSAKAGCPNGFHVAFEAQSALIGYARSYVEVEYQNNRINPSASKYGFNIFNV